MIERSNSPKPLTLFAPIPKSTESEAKKLYVKLAFLEQIIIVPSCWGGLVVSAQKMEIVDALPENVRANEQVNKTKFVFDGETGDYKPVLVKNKESIESDVKPVDAESDDEEDTRSDMAVFKYYFDCGNAEKAQVEHAIDLLKYRYEKYKETNGAITFIAEESYLDDPIKNNPILKNFEIAMKEARFYDVAALFMTRKKKPKLSINTDVNTESLDETAPTPPPLTPPLSHFNRYDDLPYESENEDVTEDESNAYDQFITKLIC